MVGLRGSGKSVEFSKVIQHFRTKKDWLVYSLSAAGNPLEVLNSKISQESFINAKTRSTTVNAQLSAGANVKILNANGNIGFTSSSMDNKHLYSSEATFSEMIKEVHKNKKKILVGIDDISKTEDMVKFLSVFESILLDGYRNIYLLVTGLAQNIEDFSAEKSLTFFKRSDSIEVGYLSQYEVSEMYQKLLKTDNQTACSLAKTVKGYAYAYQVLGSLYYNKKADETLKNLIPSFENILFKDSYDLIWKSLTVSEKELVKNIVTSETGKVSDVKSKMINPNSFCVFRNRLENKHLINTIDRGYVRIDLPRFKEFVELWGMDM